MSAAGAWLELIIVLAFALGWGVLELVGARLDRARAERERRGSSSD